MSVAPLWGQSPLHRSVHRGLPAPSTSPGTLVTSSYPTALSESIAEAVLQVGITLSRRPQQQSCMLWRAVALASMTQ